MASLPVFSFKDVKISYAGVNIEALAKDSAIIFAANSDITSEESGADGQIQISFLSDTSGICTINLQQNSPSNLVFSGIDLTQRQIRKLIRGDITISDPSGSVIALFRNCHLKTRPEVDIGEDATGKVRSWVFFVEQMEFTSAPEGLAESIPTSFSGAIDTIVSFL